ncbi:hypothetical protein BV20DRAFT_943033 [Pilatotrama ljubarskyi]|nr:hypothetical protein BV20DRAFT_943033 [Pilatotrama ljubarskyi]
MPNPVRLPFELLAHIVSYLDHDHAALRNLCLASHALHAVSYPLLFAARDFRTLDRPYLQPFLPFLSELRISWKRDMHPDREVQVLTKHLAPHLSPHRTPRLRALAIRGISSDGMAYLNTLGGALKAFTALTTLSLQCTYHRDLSSVQTLLCALPHLAHLYLDTVSWVSPGSYESDRCADPASSAAEPLAGPALKSLRLSLVYPSCMLPLVAWLARTPTARSLQTLHVPAQARMGPDVLRHFGASVRGLCVPLRGLEPSSLKNYTSLASLTLYVGVDVLTWQYGELPELLENLPCRASLQRLEIHVPYEAVTTLGSTLDVLARVDEVLFGKCPCGHNPSKTDSADPEPETRPGFPALAELRLVLLTSGDPDEQERADTEWGVRLHMRRADSVGRLVVRFGRGER